MKKHKMKRKEKKCRQTLSSFRETRAVTESNTNEQKHHNPEENIQSAAETDTQGKKAG